MYLSFIGHIPNLLVVFPEISYLYFWESRIQRGVFPVRDPDWDRSLSLPSSTFQTPSFEEYTVKGQEEQGRYKKWWHVKGPEH